MQKNIKLQKFQHFPISVNKQLVLSLSEEVAMSNSFPMRTKYKIAKNKQIVSLNLILVEVAKNISNQLLEGKLAQVQS